MCPSCDTHVAPATRTRTRVRRQRVTMSHVTAVYGCSIFPRDLKPDPFHPDHEGRWPDVTFANPTSCDVRIVERDEEESRRSKGRVLVFLGPRDKERLSMPIQFHAVPRERYQEAGARVLEEYRRVLHCTPDPRDSFRSITLLLGSSLYCSDLPLKDPIYTPMPEGRSRSALHVDRCRAEFAEGPYADVTFDDVGSPDIASRLAMTHRSHLWVDLEFIFIRGHKLALLECVEEMIANAVKTVATCP